MRKIIYNQLKRINTKGQDMDGIYVSKEQKEEIRQREREKD
jgi:hypothetical protein